MKYLKLFENYDFSKFVKDVNFWEIGELNAVPFESLKGEIIQYYAMDVEFKKGSKTIQSYDDLQRFYIIGKNRMMGSL